MFKGNARERWGKGLLATGLLLFILPVIAFGLAVWTNSSLTGYLTIQGAFVCWAVATLLTLVAFCVLVVRGKAGAAYEDREIDGG
jgi:hypothetical protein